MGAEGNLYAAWTEYEGTLWFSHSTDGGRRLFGKPKIVFRAGGHCDAPKLAVDRQGIVHLVYAESPAGPFQRYHIRHVRSHDGGRTFGAPREISGGHGQQFESVSFPALSLDGADNIIALLRKTLEAAPRTLFGRLDGEDLHRLRATLDLDAAQRAQSEILLPDRRDGRGAGDDVGVKLGFARFGLEP